MSSKTMIIEMKMFLVFLNNDIYANDMYFFLFFDFEEERKEFPKNSGFCILRGDVAKVLKGSETESA